MSEVLVIGHRNPDTDAICSAIGYAEFKRRTGMPEAVAARCGDTNERIDFVLKTFGAPAPRFVADVAPKIRDVMQTHVVSASRHSTVAEALAIMDDKSIRVLPILNEDRSCKGLVSVFKMSKFLFPAPNRLFVIEWRNVRFFAAYGLGWQIMDYRGHAMLWHSGNADGMPVYMCILPAEKIGVAVMTNSWEAGTLHGTIAGRILDTLLGHAPDKDSAPPPVTIPPDPPRIANTWISRITEARNVIVLRSGLVR